MSIVTGTAGHRAQGAAWVATPATVRPLSPMDELCFHLENDRFPWTIELEVRAGTAIDPVRLRDAVRDAMAKHPMARAQLLPYKPTDRRYQWVIVDVLEVDPVRTVDTPTEADVDRVRGLACSEWVPLDEAPAFRLWHLRRPGGDSLLLAANHAVTDGMGAVRLLRSIVRAYAGADDPVPAIDLRTDCHVEVVAAATSPVDRLSRLLGYGVGFRHANGRLSRIHVEGGDPAADGFGFAHVRLPGDVVDALDPQRHAGDGLRPTINDLLLAALHLAIADWNADHGRETERISVMMPMNLRPRASWHETVANLSLMAPVHSCDPDRDDARSLVRAIAQQTQRAKQTASPAAMLEVLQRSDWLPSIAKKAIPLLSPLSNDALVDTAVLSNLGRLDAAAGFDFGTGPTGGPATEVWFSPPARMPLGVGLGVVTFDGAMHLSFRWCRAQFDTAAADAFAGYVTTALEFVG